ncbi:MAG TPA: thiamine pyrophosphate-dependent enzyme [Acidobacteriota bacterium]|nr:thiamine pyrophosphate-dependent enzyme [Acidobacteriota bacterium]
MASTMTWHKVLEKDELPEGRVKPVTCEHLTVCMTRFEGRYAALDNKCPHQGGPLGEGSIESGMLRCPWHGWDFHPTTGKPPGGYDDGVQTFQVEERDDGIYVGFPVEAPHQRTVSDLMAETMVNWGLKTVFGMVGHSNLGLADAIRIQEEKGNLTYYGIRHEGAAAFACSAYGKLTGRPAACLSIAGPGATNLLTGLWDANVDRSPAIALTGQVDTQVLGPGAFQEVDLQAAYGKVAQWAQPVLHSSKHAELVNLAFKSAILNRGVSHLIFPDEVQNLEVSEDATPGNPRGRLPSRQITPPQDALEQAVQRLREAQRPVIIVGHGARFRMEGIIELAEQLNCPVITTFKGKGLIADSHPLGCGVLGRSGTPIASWFMNESDLLLVFGASFSNHTGITPKKPIIQVDYDPMALGKFHAVDVPVWGEIGVTCQRLREALGRPADNSPAVHKGPDRSGTNSDEQAERMPDSPRAAGQIEGGAPSGTDRQDAANADQPVQMKGGPTDGGQARGKGLKAIDQRPEIAERWRIWRQEKQSRLSDDRGKGLNSASIFAALTELLPEDAIIAVDVGNNTYSFGRYFECVDQAVLMSGYLGSIGFALPAALGAWAATQEGDPRFAGRKVVSISGDGGLGQYLAELTTAVKYGMNITHILLNNSELGKISKEQRSGNWDVWQTSLHNPSFADFAQSCGALGLRVESPSQLNSAIREALSHAGPSLVEIVSDPDLV